MTEIIMKCKYCGEEMEKLIYHNEPNMIGGVDYSCPNNCEYIEYLDKKE